MRIVKFSICLLVLIAVLTSPALAQTPTPIPTFPITPGQTLEGNINNRLFSVRYSFEGQAGENVTIRMNATSGDLDAFLLLFGPGGDLLQQNDDAGTGERNAEIAITLTDSGTHIIEATRFQQETGPSSGTFSLRLDVEGAPIDNPEDPLSRAPSFGVTFKYLDYRKTEIDTLVNSADKKYFAVGGQQGDLVRVTMTKTGGDLVPQVTLFNSAFTPVSIQAQSSDIETIVYATLPETGWYLVEAKARSGSGSFGVYADQREVAVLELGETVSGEFAPGVDTISYVINAHIGDQLIATVLEAQRGSGFSPELRLLDLRLQNIQTGRPFSDPSTRVRSVVRAAVPRSGPYILQLTNQRPETGGKFDLKLTGVPVNITKLSEEIAVPARYNELYKDVLNDTTQVNYYRFAGKAGELVTVEMTSAGIDPYVILADAQLNELTFSDNVGNTSTARLTQFALPQDGDYFILATHADFVTSTASGSYDLSLTVGQISLVSGSITATLTWDNNADLNLFIRDPQGHTISWSNPNLPDGATLQVDSNTRCQTPSAQPVEHIYWPQTTHPPTGEYQVWVWYQNVCGQPTPTTFSLKLAANSVTELEIKAEDFRLRPDERFEATFFVTEAGFFVTDTGRVTVTSPQQRASQGGDILVPYGQSRIGTISNEVFALFYQFVGRQGDEIVVIVEAVTGNLDPYVVLRDSNDNNLASNDDAEDFTVNSRLTYTLPTDGQYVIAVTRYGLRDGTTTGDFRLTVQRRNIDGSQ
jgi:hypothetical protein